MALGQRQHTWFQGYQKPWSPLLLPPSLYPPTADKQSTRASSAAPSRLREQGTRLVLTVTQSLAGGCVPVLDLQTSSEPQRTGTACGHTTHARQTPYPTLCLPVTASCHAESSAQGKAAHAGALCTVVLQHVHALQEKYVPHPISILCWSCCCTCMHRVESVVFTLLPACCLSQGATCPRVEAPMIGQASMCMAGSQTDGAVHAW